MDDLIPRKDAVERMCGINCGCTRDMCMYGDSGCAMAQFVEEIPSVSAVPLDKLCELLAEMYQCPSFGWPSSGRACHPGCPDEAFEKLCGTDCDKHTDVERWKAFLTKFVEEQDAAD